MKFIDREKYKDLCGVYRIRCIVNNMVYVGATTGKFRNRYDLHNSLLRRHKHSKKIQSDYDKYGFDAFEFFVIKPCVENIQEEEKFYINKYNSIKNGYNTNSGGDGGLVFTDESKK